MNTSEFRINENTLPLLTSLAGPDINAISPWNRFKRKTAPETQELDLLREAGLSDESGRLKEELWESITLLSNPSHFVRLRLLSGPMILEHIIYSCGPSDSANDRRISITLGNKALTIRNPAPLDLILVGFIEHWGDSIMTSSAFKQEMNREEALAFTALVDMHRRDILAARASMKPFAARSNSVDEILKNLERTPQDSQWLASAVATFNNWEPTLETQAAAAALATLENHGLLKQENSTYRLQGEALSLANHFLLISRALRFETGQLHGQSEVMHSRMLCLQAGLHENLYLEQKGDQVLAEAVSARYITGIIDVFLSNNFDLGSDLDATAADQPPVEAKIEPPSLKEKEETLLQGESPSLGEAEKARKYFISREGKSYGPYTWTEMRKFAGEGNIDRSDLVWFEENRNWTPAEEVNDLFNS
jgi:hypothetical protein